VLGEELVVWHIGVEGPHHVIAIAPRIGDLVVELVPLRLGVADEIEPVPPPTLAVMRARQQLIHHLLERLGRIVLQELRDLPRRRR